MGKEKIINDMIEKYGSRIDREELEREIDKCYKKGFTYELIDVAVKIAAAQQSDENQICITDEQAKMLGVV